MCGYRLFLQHRYVVGVEQIGYGIPFGKIAQVYRLLDVQQLNTDRSPILAEVYASRVIEVHAECVRDVAQRDICGTRLPIHIYLHERFTRRYSITVFTRGGSVRSAHCSTAIPLACAWTRCHAQLRRTIPIDPPPNPLC